MRYLASEIAEITGGRLIGADHEVCDVVTDSRGTSASSKSLFVAIRGANHDSHNYIEEMVRRGVRCVMVEREEISPIEGVTYIVVKSSSIEALQSLAAHHRSSYKGVVVGITGSNGKTVIKEWVAQTIPSNIKIFRSPRSYNSQLGVALSLLMIEGDEEVAIIEAGVSKCGEMARLERMIRPNIGVITSLGEAHQEGFSSMEEKLEEKMRLFKGAERVIYHSHYPLVGGEKMVDAARYSGGEFADIASKCNSQIVEALLDTLHYPTPKFESVTPVAMRLEIIEGLNDSIIINDSYSNDINSLAIALDTLQSIAMGRPTTVILSDILQSGREGEELYRKVAQIIARAGVDSVIGVGSEISKWSYLFHSAITTYATTEELLSHLTASEYAGRAILLKGNRESKFERISHDMAKQSHTTTLEVNLDSMIHNLNHFRAHLTPATKLVAMVKASSYGAGEAEVAQVLQHQGVDYLAVAFADEGCRLREGGITMPIIVLNADDGSFPIMVSMRLEPEIYSIRSLRAFATAVSSHGERDYPIHLKLDTGMHRLGFMEGDLEELLSELELLQGVVKVESIFSHLSSSDMGEVGAERTERQIELFNRMCAKIEGGLKYKVLRHIANSAAITEYHNAHFDMCRLGIGLYGYGGEGLRPISTLKSRIVQIRELEAGESIGYGATATTSAKSRIATIPIGYADGLNRALSGGRWSVVVRGERVPIIGRICMDSTMIDISHIEAAEEGDEVVIFSPESGCSAEDMARVLGTISYEVLTSISKRVKRIYIKE